MDSKLCVQIIMCGALVGILSPTVGSFGGKKEISEKKLLGPSCIEIKLESGDWFDEIFFYSTGR